MPDWLKFDAATGTFSGTPTNADVGDFSILLIATDKAGASASTTLNFTVADVNEAPTGSVSVTGTAAKDSVLTASNDLVDLDGW